MRRRFFLLPVVLLFCAEAPVRAQSARAHFAVPEPANVSSVPLLAPALREVRDYGAAGGVLGFIAGAVATWIVVNHGGSTAPCDRENNQDAWQARECTGVVLLGGFAGAGLGWAIGSRIER